MRETPLLAGDGGATKTKLAIFTAEGGARNPLRDATFGSAQSSSLEALVRGFLTEAGASVDRASSGVAGPVVDGRAAITNLPWVIDGALLARALNLAAVRLLSDLDALAHEVPILEPDDQQDHLRAEPAWLAC